MCTKATKRYGTYVSIVSVRKIPEDKWSFSPDPQNSLSDPRKRKLSYIVHLILNPTAQWEESVATKVVPYFILRLGLKVSLGISKYADIPIATFGLILL